MTLPVKKTYKLFVGGKFPRSESARSYQPSETKHIHVTRGSRKDLRDAVLAARIGQKAWSSSSAYLRGQILYRLAEMLETRSAALCEELAQSGVTKANAKRRSLLRSRWLFGMPVCLTSCRACSARRMPCRGHFFRLARLNQAA